MMMLIVSTYYMPETTLRDFHILVHLFFPVTLANMLATCSPTFQLGKLGHTELKQFTQGHIANKQPQFVSETCRQNHYVILSQSVSRNKWHNTQCILEAQQILFPKLSAFQSMNTNLIYIGCMHSKYSNQKTQTDGIHLLSFFLKKKKHVISPLQELQG